RGGGGGLDSARSPAALRQLSDRERHRRRRRAGGDRLRRRAHRGGGGRLRIRQPLAGARAGAAVHVRLKKGRAMARKRMINAINEALAEEMDRDSKVILFGEDVQISVMGDTRGL